MENSALIGEEQFDKVKDFAKQFVDAFDISDRGTHAAVVSYGTRPVTHTRLNSYSGPALNKRTITDKIDEIDFRSDGPASTSSALTEVLNTVYADGNGARNGTNKVTDLWVILALIAILKFCVSLNTEYNRKLVFNVQCRYFLGLGFD